MFDIDGEMALDRGEKAANLCNLAPPASPHPAAPAAIAEI
jgi:hypothetical protein